MRKWIASRVVVMAAAVVGVTAWGVGEPATAPATRRAGADVESDLNATMKRLETVLPSLATVGEPELRSGAAPQAIPLLRKASGLFVEMAGTRSVADEKSGLLAQSYEMKEIGIGLGDNETQKELEVQPASNLQAKVALLVGEYWQHADDAKAQLKVLDAVTPLVAANGADDDLADALSNMFHVGAADYSVKQKIIEITRAHMTNDGAKQLVAEGNSLAEMKKLEGKPLVVAGRTDTGGSFSTDAWKGKVVLVDFWATWCVPCRALIPGTKSLYQELHAKGFEVVGVNNDDSDAPAVAFAKENDMPWPELRETSQNDEDYWHPLTKKWGVKILPAMFLIDKKGIVRDVEADEHTAAKVRKLMAE